MYIFHKIWRKRSIFGNGTTNQLAKKKKIVVTLISKKDKILYITKIPYNRRKEMFF